MLPSQMLLQLSRKSRFCASNLGKDRAQPCPFKKTGTVWDPLLVRETGKRGGREENNGFV